LPSRITGSNSLRGVLESSLEVTGVGYLRSVQPIDVADGHRPHVDQSPAHDYFLFGPVHPRPGFQVRGAIDPEAAFGYEVRLHSVEQSASFCFGFLFLGPKVMPHAGGKRRLDFDHAVADLLELVVVHPLRLHERRVENGPQHNENRKAEKTEHDRRTNPEEACVSCRCKVDAANGHNGGGGHSRQSDCQVRMPEASGQGCNTRRTQAAFVVSTSGACSRSGLASCAT
jgi:hypothetical protein